MKKKDPYDLTEKEALTLLLPHIEKRKKRVHSFEGGPFLMGCDIDLTQVKKYLKETESIKLSGPNMHAMGHGIAFFDKKRGYTFLETDMDKVNEILKTRKINKDYKIK